MKTSTLLLLAAAGYYYFKIYRPNHLAALATAAVANATALPAGTADTSAVTGTPNDGIPLIDDSAVSHEYIAGLN